MSSELGFAATALVALVAGFIRGFSGFGGPAFMVAILVLFYAPIVIVSKVVVIDLVTSLYLTFNCRREIDWRSTAFLAIPTMLSMPLGQWLLLEIDAVLMRRLIAAIIAIVCVVMLIGVRYQKPMTKPVMIGVGLVSGLVFGATYIALVVVAAILLGPYSKSETRTLIISWAFIVSVWYAVISFISGTTVVDDVLIALPAAALYFIGTWFGVRLFRGSSEGNYRHIALGILLILAILGFLK